MPARTLVDAVLVTRAWLVTQTAVTALVGQRIYGARLPAAPTFPAIRIQRIGSTVVDEDAALDAALLQVDCWATSLSAEQEAWTVATTVRTALRNMRNYTHPAGYVAECRTESGPQWLPDADLDKARQQLDVRVWTIPTP